MFNGFPSTNTPAIQVWDFASTQASTSAFRTVGLPDDCAPIQLFKTGAATTEVNVYLPSAPIEGKVIKICNHRYGSSTQNIRVWFNDGSGAAQYYSVGTGQFIDFIYSKVVYSAPSGGAVRTGWASLNQVALGASNYHAIAAGDTNAATAAQSLAIGGNNNTASGSNAAVLGGANHTASGSNAAALGGSSSSVTGTNSGVFAGTIHQATSQGAVVIGGSYGTTRTIIGYTVLPASNNPITGGAGITQSALLLLARETTDATLTTLASNTAAAGTTNQVVLPNNSAYYVRGSCIANVTGGGNTKAWSFEAAIKRGANAASTALVGTVTKNVVAADTGAATWDITLSADTTNGCFRVQVTGQAATTIRWVCKVETTEVTF